MSLNITVSVPADVVASIRAINYDLERVDGEVEFTLATITSAVIESVKALPEDDIPHLQSQSRRTSGSASSTFSDPFVSFRSCSSGSASSRLTVSSSATGLGIFYDDLEVAIVDSSGRRHYVSAKSSMMIDELKGRMEEHCGQAGFEQSLIWKSYRLNQPDATLNSYGIRHGAQLELLQRRSTPASPKTVPKRISFPNAQFDFNLQTVSGATLTIHARYDTTTAELATAIWESESIFPSMQVLTLNDEILYDGCEYANGGEHLLLTLQEAGFFAGCTVQVRVAGAGEQRLQV